MNWKKRYLIPWLKALLHSLGTFVALSLLAAAWSAYAIWILGKCEPKWGDEWANFRFNMTIYSAMTGIQTGVVFICSSIIALVRGQLVMRWSMLSIALLCLLNVCLAYYALQDELRGFIILLGVCPILASGLLLMPARKHQGGIQPTGGGYVLPADGQNEPHP